MVSALGSPIVAEVVMSDPLPLGAPSSSARSMLARRLLTLVKQRLPRYAVWRCRRSVMWVA